MFADSYPMREVEDGFFFEVDGSVRKNFFYWIFIRAARERRAAFSFFSTSTPPPPSFLPRSFLN